MSSARGNWLALLDADDGFAPDRLARLVALGEARGADVVDDNLRLVTARGRVLGEELPPQDPLFVEGLTAARSVRRNNFLTAGFNLDYSQHLFRTGFIEAQSLRQTARTRVGEALTSSAL